MSAERIRCRCGEPIEGEIAQIKVLQAAATQTEGDVRDYYLARARTRTEQLAEDVRVLQLSQEHAEGDAVRRSK